MFETIRPFPIANELWNRFRPINFVNSSTVNIAQPPPFSSAPYSTPFTSGIHLVVAVVVVGGGGGWGEGPLFRPDLHSPTWPHLHTETLLLVVVARSFTNASAMRPSSKRPPSYKRCTALRYRVLPSFFKSLQILQAMV